MPLQRQKNRLLLQRIKQFFIKLNKSPVKGKNKDSKSFFLQVKHCPQKRKQEVK
jgi:hypothetical protein